MKKEINVTIKRSGKLTLTEINALTQKVLEDAQEIINIWNQSYETCFDFQRRLKSLKTKHGILAAERAIVFIATKHKKVKISVESEEYELALEKLHLDFKKRKLVTYKGSNVFEKVKNELIIAQISNDSMVNAAKEISLRLVKNI